MLEKWRFSYLGYVSGDIRRIQQRFPAAAPLLTPQLLPQTPYSYTNPHTRLNSTRSTPASRHVFWWYVVQFQPEFHPMC